MSDNIGLAPVSTTVKRADMTTPSPIHLSRRGELLRAVSHAIRCLNQASTNSEEQRREAIGFKERIRSQYSDVLEQIPVEFEPWLDNKAAGIYDAQQQERINNLLSRIGYEIQREKQA